MSGASPVARIEQLKQIEKEVVAILHNAGQALQELSTERPGRNLFGDLSINIMYVRGKNYIRH